jgi:hypothetical protein
MSIPLIRYVMIAALRDRLLLGMALMLVLACALSVFLGSAAIIEQDRFAVIYAAGAIRGLNVFGLVLFTVFFIRRGFEARDVDLMLSRPVGRTGFILSYAAGLSLLALLLGVLSGGLVAALSLRTLSDGHWLWTLSQVGENIVMVNAALFFAMVLSSAPMAAFAVSGFYILARMMSQVLGIIDSGKLDMQHQILQTVMQGISMLMPRLDLLGQTSWLVYGPDPQVGGLFIAGQCAVYALVLVAAACIDLERRQF